MRLSDHLRPEGVLVDPPPGREVLLAGLVNRICSIWGEGDPVDLLGKVWEREGKGSTAVGLGVSVPHLRSSSLSDLRAVVALLPTGSDLPSGDGMPVRLVVLLASPETKASLHVKALAQIARLDARAIDLLVTSPGPGQFLDRLRGLEDRRGGA